MDLLNQAQQERYWPGENLATIARENPQRFFLLMRQQLGDTVTLRDPTQFLHHVQAHPRQPFRDGAGRPDVNHMVK